MKYFFLFSLWIPIVSSAQIRVDAQGDKLNGRVRNMVEYHYSVFADSNLNRVPDMTAIYSYNDEMNEETVYHFWGSDSLKCIYRTIVKYNKDKLTQQRLLSHSNGHGDYAETDSISSTITYKYDKKGRLLQDISRGVSFTFWRRYIYDEKGNVAQTDVRTNGVSSGGRPFGIKTTFKYDDSGHIIQENTDDVGVVYHTTYKYDSNYRYAEKHRVDVADAREWKTKCRYDNRMKLIEEVSNYNADGAKGTFQEHGPHINNEYKYDENGNWIERTYYLYGKKDGYIKRVITY